jgi:hypothetical protein
VQPVALQFRVGNTGNFTNVPAGFVADATTGPSLATLVTPVSVTLPAAADNQPLVQVRIITGNATRSDEWVGVDDINVTGAPLGPTGIGNANPNPVTAGNSTLLTVATTPAGSPIVSVVADLTAVGGSASQAFVDDGTGTLGLNGEGQGTLRFNLAPWAGQKITLRLLYTSDVGVQWQGWWADDLKLADGSNTLFYDNVENPPNGWTTNHFVITPLTRTFPMYYLAEWRNNSGFDRGLQYPYQTVYNNAATTEWEVDRCPYTVPGMLLWLRNGARDFDYTLSDSWYDPPSRSS